MIKWEDGPSSYNPSDFSDKVSPSLTALLLGGETGEISQNLAVLMMKTAPCRSEHLAHDWLEFVGFVSKLQGRPWLRDRMSKALPVMAGASLAGKSVVILTNRRVDSPVKGCKRVPESYCMEVYRLLTDTRVTETVYFLV